MNIQDFTEYTNQDIEDKSLLVWSKKDGYFFTSYDEWVTIESSVRSSVRIIGVEK